MKILKQGYPVAAQAVPTKRYCQTLDLREDPELIASYKKVAHQGRYLAGDIRSNKGFRHFRDGDIPIRQPPLYDYRNAG